MSQWDPAKIAADLAWLQDHPWFAEKPASIIEFLGPDYLNIEKNVRPGVRAELIHLFGEEVNGHRIARVRWAMFTGAIGIGKTTMASIIIPYMAHWCLCLKDPQDFYDLMPGSRIAFMQMSTSEDQAKETLFGDIKARIEHSPWFQNNYPYDPTFKNQIRFEKDVWIIPGSSKETSFEGYNILGGILDEADSHNQTQNKDYADVGFDTINSRIDSRFQDRGFLLVVGQMKKANGFAAKKYREFNADPENAHTVRMTIWESLGWQRFSDENGNRLSFWYDTKRKEIIHADVPKMLGYPEHILEIPKVYEKNFRNNPEKALRDLAGIPPLAGSAFISLSYKIEDAVARWKELYSRDEGPVSSDPVRPVIAEWFRATTPLIRTVHLDIGITNDAAGIVMGHVSHLVKDEDTGEEKPFIVIDCMIRCIAPKGGEVIIADLRKYIYNLKARGFRIRGVTMDGFQSTDTRQQMRKKKFKTDYLSIDKSKLPYEDLRDALYEDRIAIPPYVTRINVGDSEDVEIAIRELSELEENDRKIDHPASGSKDVADGIAGVVTTLMGDRKYRRNLGSGSESDDETDSFEQATGTDGYRTSGQHRFGGMDLKAPIPPSLGGNVISFPIPPSLQPRRGS